MGSHSPASWLVAKTDHDGTPVVLRASPEPEGARSFLGDAEATVQSAPAFAEPDAPRTLPMGTASPVAAPVAVVAPVAVTHEARVTLAATASPSASQLSTALPPRSMVWSPPPGASAVSQRPAAPPRAPLVVALVGFLLLGVVVSLYALLATGR